VNPSSENPIAANGTAQLLLGCYESIADDLTHVERILREEMSSRYPNVNKVVSYGCMLGGKRLRPALLLLTAKCLGSVSEDHHKLGAVLEMVHTATLIHDDVIDGASQRRHLETIHQRWSTEAAVLTGDFLFSHAFYLASTLPTTTAAQKIGQATNIVCEGELRQITTKGQFDLSEEDYFSIIESKTAVLCQVACELGAIYTNATDEQIQQAGEFGRCLGIAFQIVDDLLDIEGTSDCTGKTLGTDLKQRKPTLPLIHVLEAAPEGPKQAIYKALHSDNLSASEIIVWMEEFGSLQYARDRAIGFIERAHSAIANWPTSPAASALRDLAGFVLKRCH